MPAHILFREIDSQPAGFSEFWLQTILRDSLEFSGVIFSDDLAMEGASFAGDFCTRAEAALRAGCDSILICNQREDAEKVIEFLESRPDLKRKARLDHLRCARPAEHEPLQNTHRWARAQDLVTALT